MDEVKSLVDAYNWETATNADAMVTNGGNALRALAYWSTGDVIHIFLCPMCRAIVGHALSVFVGMEMAGADAVREALARIDAELPPAGEPVSSDELAQRLFNEPKPLRDFPLGPLTHI